MPAASAISRMIVFAPASALAAGVVSISQVLKVLDAYRLAQITDRLEERRAAFCRHGAPYAWLSRRWLTRSGDVSQPRRRCGHEAL